MSSTPALSQRKMAAGLDVAHSLVARYSKEGMPMTSVRAAKAWISDRKLARIKPNRPEGVPPPAPPTKRSAAARGTSGEAEKEAEDGAEQPGDYWVNRARREKAEADLAELKAAELAGDLVRRADVRTQLARRTAALRDGLLQIPARLQSVVAAEADEAKCHDLIQDEIYLVLAQFTEARDAG